MLRDNALLRDENTLLGTDVKRSVAYNWHASDCDIVQKPGSPCNCQGNTERDLVRARWEGKL
jgi:hypothetical protein